MTEAEELEKWRGWKPQRCSRDCPPWPEPIRHENADWQHYIRCGGCKRQIAWRVGGYRMRWEMGIGALGKRGLHAVAVCERCAEEAPRQC